MNWTIGADVEMMLEKGGKLISAVPLLPADEKADELPHGTVFHDNVLAEFTIAPAADHDEFARNILENVDAITARLAKNGVKPRIVASARYPKSELTSEQAQRFGCDPDYDAYEMTVNKVAAEAHETDLRSAGGHVHFAHPIFNDPYKVLDMIKLMDLYLGVASVVFDKSLAGKERRTLYGKAGAHRPKAYPGGEYRSLSNFWIKDKWGIRWVYEQTQICLEHVLKNETVESLGWDENEIRRIINEGDVKAAQDVVDKLGLECS
jgi:hypothetical protein